MIYERGQLRWIESSGGPLLLLSFANLTAWSGHTGSLKRNIDGLNGAESDYERACAVEDYLGMIAIADGYGIVLAEEPMATAWRPESSSEGILIRWVFGEDQERLPQYLSHIDEEIWRPTGISLKVGEDPLYLFDAAWPGAKVAEHEHLTLSLDAGNYRFDTGTLRIGDKTELILHRLQRR